MRKNASFHLLFLIGFVFLQIISPTCRNPFGIKRGGIYFESSWESGTGKSDFAVMDNGKWDNRTTDGGINYIEVISELTTPLGTIYPVDGANMLSIGARGSDYENIEIDEYIRMEDEHTYLRFYTLMLKPSEGNGGLHGIQDLSCCADGAGSVNFWVYHISIGLNPHNPLTEEDNWYIGFVFRDYFTAIGSGDYSINDYFGNGHYMWGNSWEAEVRMWPEGSTSPPQEEAFDFYRWYRIETHIHWLAKKTFRTPALYYMRVYDDNNQLIIDENNLYCDTYDGSWQPVVKSLSELYSIGNSAEGRTAFINATHRCLMIGTNGFNSADEPRLYLVDKLAISSAGWIGE